MTDSHNSTQDAGPDDGRDELPFIRNASYEYLNPRQKPEYREEMRAFYAWMLEKGTDIDNEEGQTEATAVNNVRRINNILPIIWEAHSGYTLHITTEMADWYVSQLDADAITQQNGESYAGSTKRKHVCALLAYMRYRWDARSGDIWEPERMFGSSGRSAPMADPVTLEERMQIREASLEYGTIKQYNNCSPEERDRIKAYLAQRLEKSKDDVVKQDWQRANQCWKIPALIMLTLDTGLRPKEVERAKVSWLKISDGTIVIPREDAVKNDDAWICAITERTSRALRRWKKQRNNRPKYDDTDLLWLTREGNPYSSGPLGRLLRNIMDEAGIDYSDRDISWYSLRHSLGTQLALEGDLKQVQNQLRHKCIESTFKYLHPPDREVRDNLDKIS